MVKKKAVDDAYRIYITDTLYFIANGKAPKQRFMEFLHPQQQEETRKPEEIINSVKSGLERLVNK